MSRVVALASLGALLLAIAACAPAAEVGGCGKDTDCKGDRICVQRACVHPPGDAPPPARRPIPPSEGPPPEPPPPPVVVPRPSAPPPPPPPPRTNPVPAPSSGEVHSGDPPPARGKCGCAPDDLMCNLRCSSQRNPARPRLPAPSPPGPPGPQGF